MHDRLIFATALVEHECDDVRAPAALALHQLILAQHAARLVRRPAHPHAGRVLHATNVDRVDVLHGDIARAASALSGTLSADGLHCMEHAF